MKVDLHNHSTASDGKYSPTELIDYAISKGIDVMALTDHDCTFGIKKALEYSKDKNIEIIPGLELSTIHNGEPVHIIGLFKNKFIPEEINKLGIEIKNGRRIRAIEMLNKISDIFNVEISISELMSSDIITRGNMYQHIQKHNANLTSEEINQMVSKDSPAYIELPRFRTKEGIDFLHRNNAICIYAHPTLNSRKTNMDVLEMGLDGIEYKYPKNKPGDEEFYLNEAKKRGLFLSAGSDFHGDDNHADIGTVFIGEKEYKIIKERLGI